MSLPDQASLHSNHSNVRRTSYAGSVNGPDDPNRVNDWTNTRVRSLSSVSGPSFQPRRRAVPQRAYVVDALSRVGNMSRVPVMFGHINLTNSQPRPTRSVDLPRGSNFAAGYTRSPDGPSIIDTVGLPFLHQAYQILTKADPKTRAEKSRFAKGHWTASRLSSADLLFLSNLDSYNGLNDGQLLNIIRALRTTISGLTATLNPNKLTAATYLLKFLLATKLRQADTLDTRSSAERQRARKIALKVLNSLKESEAPPSFNDRFYFNGVLGLSPNEIGELVIESFEDEVREDPNGLMHLDPYQMAAFIRRIRQLQRQNPNSPSLAPVMAFIRDRIAYGLYDSVGEVLRDYPFSSRQSASDVISRLGAIREVERQLRHLLPNYGADMHNIQMHSPESIAMMGSIDFMNIDPRSIIELDHAQVLALAFVARRIAEDIDASDQPLSNVWAQLFRVQDALRDRVKGSLIFIYQEPIQNYASRAADLITHVDVEFIDPQRGAPLPISNPIPRNTWARDPINPVDFVRGTHFSEVEATAIELIDLDAILDEDSTRQCQWFFSNDLNAILASQNAEKIIAWAKLLRYLHHYTTSNRLSLAIEEHVSLLRHQWVLRNDNQLNQAQYDELVNQLEAVLEVGFSRLQVGSNGLVSIRRASRDFIDDLSLDELLNVDLRELSLLSCDEVEDYAYNLNRLLDLRQLRQFDTDDLSADEFDSIALYQRLAWLYQRWAIKHFAVTPAQDGDKRVLDKLKIYLDNCFANLPRINPYTRLAPEAVDRNLRQYIRKPVVPPAPQRRPKVPDMPPPPSARVDFSRFTSAQLLNHIQILNALNIEQNPQDAQQIVDFFAEITRRHDFDRHQREVLARFADATSSALRANAADRISRGVPREEANRFPSLLYLSTTLEAYFDIANLYETPRIEGVLQDSLEENFLTLLERLQVHRQGEAQLASHLGLQADPLIRRVRETFNERMKRASDFIYENFYNGNMATSSPADWRDQVFVYTQVLDPEIVPIIVQPQPQVRPQGRLSFAGGGERGAAFDDEFFPELNFTRWGSDSTLSGTLPNQGRRTPLGDADDDTYSEN